jgi:hypothetical protein
VSRINAARQCGAERCDRPKSKIGVLAPLPGRRTVSLHGVLTDYRERNAIPALVKNVDGVRSIHDHRLRRPSFGNHDALAGGSAKGSNRIAVGCVRDQRGDDCRLFARPEEAEAEEPFASMASCRPDRKEFHADRSFGPPHDGNFGNVAFCDLQGEHVRQWIAGDRHQLGSVVRQINDEAV